MAFALGMSSAALLFVSADELCVSFFDGVPFYVSQIQSSGNDDDVVFKLQALLGILLTPAFFLSKKQNHSSHLDDALLWRYAVIIDFLIQSKTRRQRVQCTSST